MGECRVDGGRVGEGSVGAGRVGGVGGEAVFSYKMVGVKCGHAWLPPVRVVDVRGACDVRVMGLGVNGSGRVYVKPREVCLGAGDA